MRRTAALRARTSCPIKRGRSAIEFLAHLEKKEQNGPTLRHLAGNLQIPVVQQVQSAGSPRKPDLNRPVICPIHPYQDRTHRNLATNLARDSGAGPMLYLGSARSHPVDRRCRTFAGISHALLCISVQLATGVTEKS